MYLRAGFFTIFILAAGASIAQTPDLNDVGTRLIGQTGQLATFLWRVIFVTGVVLTITGLWKFYGHVQSPNDPAARKNVAFVYIVAGCLMVALPSVMGTGITTFFGSGATDSVAGGLQGFKDFD
jgi:hypothetical protein